MELEVGFGNGVQRFTVPERNLQGVLTPNPVPHALTGEREVRRALSSPIGAPLLREVIHPGEKIAIITSDITRPMPTYTVMPALLDELYAGGARPEDITLVFALGSHRAQTPEEMRHLAGEQAWAQIRCVDSDPADVVHLGVTSAGTPVDITRVVAEADRRICRIFRRRQGHYARRLHSQRDPVQSLHDGPGERLRRKSGGQPPAPGH